MDHDTPSRDFRSPTLEPGVLLNGLYRLVRFLGVGGMGEVWEARHERTKGRVAVKLLLPELGRHEGLLLRFQREVEITSGLNHPNIVRVSDADKLHNGSPFLVMEFLEGHDLSYVLQAGQAVGLARAIEIVEQVAMGLQAAHDQSIIHRDLKPANIFIVPLPGTGRVVVKILDFGISKALDGLGLLTHSGSMMGTPNYMAPEQATRGASFVDARADQFSLAAIAYELLTGCLAFEGDGMVNVIFKVVHEFPPPFSARGISMPFGVEEAVMRGLSKLPADRFRSVVEFSEELKRKCGQVDSGWPIHTTSRRTAQQVSPPRFPDIHPLTSTSGELPRPGKVPGAVTTSLKTSATRPWGEHPHAVDFRSRIGDRDDIPSGEPKEAPEPQSEPVSIPSRRTDNHRKWVVLGAAGPVLAIVAWTLLSRNQPSLRSAPVTPEVIAVGTTAHPPVSERPVTPSSGEADDDDRLVSSYLDSAEGLVKTGRFDLVRNLLAKASHLRIKRADLGARMSRLSRALTIGEAAAKKKSSSGTETGTGTKIRSLRLAAKDQYPPQAKLDSPPRPSRPEETLIPEETPNGSTVAARIIEPPPAPPFERLPKVAASQASPRPTTDSGSTSIPSGAMHAPVHASLNSAIAPSAAPTTNTRASAGVGPTLSTMPKSPIPKPRLPHSAFAETPDGIARLCQLVEATAISAAGVSPEFARGITLPLRAALGGSGTVYPVGMYYFIIREASLKHDNRAAAQALVKAQSNGLLLRLGGLPADDPGP